MKITFLGTGTSIGVPQIGCQCEVCRSNDPRDKRLRASALFEKGDTRLLVDCGPDFREQMLKVDFKRLDAIFITHEHYDHVGGLDDLRPFSIFGDVVVYAEQTVVQHLRQRIPYCFTPKEKRYPGVPSIDLEEMTPHVPVQVGSVQVLPLRVMHGKLPILGFRIGDFAYTTDMLTMPDADVALLQGVRKMIVNGLRHEPHMSHQTLEQAIAFTERLGKPEAWLIHMSHHIRPHAIEAQSLPQHVHLAYDGEVIQL